MTAHLRRPAVAGALASLALLLVWWQLLWTPQGAALAAAHRQEQAQSTNLFTVEQNIGHLKHLQTISPKLSALEARLSTAAPASDQVDQFLLSLSSLTQDAGVTVSSISLAQPAAAPAGLEVIGLHLSLQGDYLAVQHLLDTLRAANRILVVDSLSETPARTPGKSSGSAVTLSLTAHLLTGLTAPPAAVQAVLAGPPTTKPPTGIISGPVTKARNAVSASNAATSGLNAQTSAPGGP